MIMFARRHFCRTLAMTVLLAAMPQPVPGQTASPSSAPATTPAVQTGDSPSTPNIVKVVPVAQDDEIATRLERILTATEWFRNCHVEVDEGVAFLQGETTEAKYKDWATNLAQKTDDVVAVVNRIKVTQRALWDLSPAWNQLREMGRATIQGLPLFGIALVVLAVTWIVTRYFSSAASRAIGRRTPNPILQQVGSRAIAFPLMVLGIYLALRISGLTQIAATVVGGTGLIGLIVGIAFRDIAENFLASILISMQRPFQLGDLIDVNNVQGIVQSVTTRGTLLITLDGNHVQIPNSLIYKNVIRNLTANPKIRIQFSYPVTGKTSPETAQKAVMEVLRNHHAVQSDPEPLVLVDEVNATGYVLKIYFWIDGHAFSSAKVKSAVLRLVHGAVQTLNAESGQRQKSLENSLEHGRNGNSISRPGRSSVGVRNEAGGNVGEGGLHSEQPDLEKQVKACSRVDESTNLLKSETPPPASPVTDQPAN